jgi:hypothetical protein
VGLPAYQDSLILAARPGILLIRPAILLIVTAHAEAGTGLLLLVWPPGLLALLLGVDQASPETTCCARIAGAALLAIGVACWIGRADTHSSGQLGLLIGVFIYDVAAAVILAYTGLFTDLVGLALWPAVVLHGALAGWCVACLWPKPRNQHTGSG